MLDHAEAGFPSVLERLLPRLRSFAVILLGPGAQSDAVLQIAVAVAAAHHLLAAARRGEAGPAMPQAVAAVLGAWLDQAPGAADQVGQAMRELFEELAEAAAQARTAGKPGAAALQAAAAELESGHGWLWLAPSLPKPRNAGA